MFNQLVVLGWTIIVFAILLGVGTVILEKLSGAVASCPTGYAYQTNGSVSYTTGRCCLTGGVDCSSAGNYTSASQGTQATYYMQGQLGSTTGLASWTPAVIALAIGLLFIGAFMLNRSRKA